MIKKMDERELLIQRFVHTRTFQIMFVLSGILTAFDALVKKTGNIELAIVFMFGGLSYGVFLLYYNKKF